MRFPHLKIITDKVEFAVANAFVIRINPFYKNNKGLYEHEYEHVKQFWLAWLTTAICFGYFFPMMIIMGVATHSLLYNLSKKYRLWSEVKAYKKQIKVDGYGLDYYAEYLSKEYRLDINFTEAKKLLS